MIARVSWPSNFFMLVIITMDTEEQQQQPLPPLQIPSGYVILKLSGRDYIVPQFLVRSTTHAIGAVELSENAGIYGQHSGVRFCTASTSAPATAFRCSLVIASMFPQVA